MVETRPPSSPGKPAEAEPNAQWDIELKPMWPVTNEVADMRQVIREQTHELESEAA